MIEGLDPTAPRRTLWRGLEELERDPDFVTRLAAEFPAAAVPEVGRREVLKLLGASAALAGLTGCTGEPDEKALPYVEQPEFTLPGIARRYATAVTLGGWAQPAIGTTREGRPIKLDGNPDHPASRGGTDAFTQAALLGLYDPERSRLPRRLGRPADWAAFDRAVVEHARQLDASAGEGFRLLTGRVTSPTLARQVAALTGRWPKARWHVFEAVDEGGREDAVRTVFGRDLDAVARLDRAEVVVSLDDDLLGPGPRQTMHGRLWGRRREAAQRGEGASLLFVAEPSPTNTGIVAADRLATAPNRIAALAAGLAARFGEGAAPELRPDETRWVERAATALERARGKALVTAGARHDPAIQALALRLTATLGGLGTVLTLHEPASVAPPDGTRSFAALVTDMEAGRVSSLAILDANPAYAAPGSVGFAALMQRVPLRIHAGLHFDETGAECHWHAPLLHDLDGWSDARAVDGSAVLAQPLVRPFVDARSRHVVVQNLLGDLSASDHDLVRATWRAAWGDGFEARWTKALRRGVAEDAREVPTPPTVATPSQPPHPEALRAAEPRRTQDGPACLEGLSGSAGEPSAPDDGPPRHEEGCGPPPPRGLSVLVAPDPTVWDGRFATNAWLQELPKPLSKLTWDNAITIAPALATRLGLSTGDEARLAVEGRSVTGPVFVQPGQDASTVLVHLGYGRRGAGEIGNGQGFDVAPLRSLDRPWVADGATLTPTGGKRVLATTQIQGAMAGHDFVRSTPRGEAPDVAGEPPKGRGTSLYPDQHYGSPSWGLSIDLDLCIGCSACTAACQAENNIAVVGREQVANGRHMQWIRVDRYFEGEPDDPALHVQPVPCMHCEQAPCEMGCPVNATTHSPDGLNQQVYNRCIGTRTCSSYCPYKVRRFNFFDYTSRDANGLQAARNPDVTVRSRGVMEKCTYCVQRISAARITAKKENREIRDGEVVTACQQACPTSAIVFGDVTKPDTAVSRRKASGRDYALLAEVNTRPRTTYLARIADEPEGGK